MTKKQAIDRIKELREITAYHAKKYYDDDNPEISDFEYDMLMLELRNLEKDFPEFQSEKSLTKKVGGTVKEGFQKVTHEVPLLSLQDVFSLEDVEDFVTRMEQKAKENGWIVVQDTAWEGYTDIPTWIMQGYTTIGQEIIEQLQGQKITHIFLQAGVGSMAGAITGFFVNHWKEEKPIIIVVEPQKANCLYQTAKANDGNLHCVTGEMDTIMAGLACGEPCSIGWNILKGYAEAFFSCPEYVAADGMRMLAAPVKGDTAVISGESGAAGFGCMANLLQDKELEEFKKKLKLDKNSNILCISTEGDTDAQNYQNIVWGGKYSKFEGGGKNDV